MPLNFLGYMFLHSQWALVSVYHCEDLVKLLHLCNRKGKLSIHSILFQYLNELSWTMAKSGSVSILSYTVT